MLPNTTTSRTTREGYKNGNEEKTKEEKRWT
jgi:hypothetical protein